jgi:4-hydroxy-3-polyprenylbenzoate decarboxylase
MLKMAYSGLTDFIAALEKINELRRIKVFADPILEIAEITDRITKSGGKALLFENNGTKFPLLINAFGTDRRMAMAIGRNTLEDAGREIEILFNRLSDSDKTFFKKLALLPSLFRLSDFLPSRSKKRGECQQVIEMIPDLGILPVLKCWPHDGGRFITLPMVHTIHPETGKTNVGMYRMQVLDKNTTAMHWQRHKTGANHFDAWKKADKKMPVTVTLGGDPVYTYSATAPLPENISEYILAGFLRKKKVSLVKCLTNNLYVPDDADIVIEGYVDTSEEPVWEGPFGDHTGFYSLADWYPKFHVTCITHSKKAVYPAIIVGVPPQEDVLFAKATEKIFLPPMKLTIQPEIEDFHIPDAGVAHNLVIVRIRKSYPGQGMKVISSLLGAGQMMFTKYLIVVSGDIDIRNYIELTAHVFANTDLSVDIMFCHGPLDVLDHSSDSFSFGGKAGVDATIKHPEETAGRKNFVTGSKPAFSGIIKSLSNRSIIKSLNPNLFSDNIPILIVSVDFSEDMNVSTRLENVLRANDPSGNLSLVLVVDHTVDTEELYKVAWQVLGNSDPQRDHVYLSPASLIIYGTIKARVNGIFPRKWPNVVCSDFQTILAIDQKWESLGLGPFINSPSLKIQGLCRKGKDEILLNEG